MDSNLSFCPECGTSTSGQMNTVNSPVRYNHKSAGLAALLYFGAGIPVCGTLAVFLFNMTMPITLWAAARLLPGAKGFAFGLLTRKQTNDRYVPYIAVASPLICFALDWLTSHYMGYKFGYELLMLNGLLTFAGLWMAGRKMPVTSHTD